MAPKLSLTPNNATRKGAAATASRSARAAISSPTSRAAPWDIRPESSGALSANRGQRALPQRRDRDLAAVLLDRLDHRVADLLRACRCRESASASRPESANIPASRIVPGLTTETPTPVPRRSSRRQRAKPRSPNLVAAVERGPRGRGPARRATRRRRGAPRRARSIAGNELSRHPDRGLEVDPQRPPDLLLGEAVEPARRGQRRVGDEDVDLARLGEQALSAAPSSARSATIARWPSPGSRAGELVELLGLARADQDGARPSRRAPARSRARARRWPRSAVRSCPRAARREPTRSASQR